MGWHDNYVSIRYAVFVNWRSLFSHTNFTPLTDISPCDLGSHCHTHSSLVTTSWMWGKGNQQGHYVCVLYLESLFYIWHEGWLANGRELKGCEEGDTNWEEQPDWHWLALWLLLWWFRQLSHWSDKQLGPGHARNPNILLSSWRQTGSGKLLLWKIAKLVLNWTVFFNRWSLVNIETLYSNPGSASRTA